MGDIAWLRNVVDVRSISLNGNTIKIEQRKMGYNINVDLVSMIIIIKNGIPVTEKTILKWLKEISLKEDIIILKG